MFYRVQSTIPEFNDEDEELQEVLKLSRREAEFKEGRDNTMSMVEEEGEVE
jgi:hypothetical protein